MSVASALLCCCEPTSSCSTCGTTSYLVTWPSHFRFQSSCACQSMSYPSLRGDMDLTIDDPSVVATFDFESQVYCQWSGSWTQDYPYGTCFNENDWVVRITFSATIRKFNYSSGHSGEMFVELTMNMQDIVEGVTTSPIWLMNVNYIYPDHSPPQSCPNGEYAVPSGSGLFVSETSWESTCGSGGQAFPLQVIAQLTEASASSTFTIS